MRERSGRAAANKAWKRFSCGSLFDSEGKYSGHLMELITSELYSSQVRRWCLQKDDCLQVFENEASDKPFKIIPLFDAKVVDTSDVDACVYRFRIDYGGNKSVFFRALTRSDLEKWTTVISVKSAVLQDRSERQRRRSRTLSLEESTHDLAGSSESDVAPSDIHSSKHITVDSISLQSPVSTCSYDSVFMRSTSAEEKTSISSSGGLIPVESVTASDSSILEPKDEQSTDNEEYNSGDAALSESGNVERVNKLSSIDDLSHMYENFLAFATVMAESNPEQLYHVYENVTQALESGSQGRLLSKEGEGIDDNLVASADQKTKTENEVGSPSSEINSEFEKISLGDKEDRPSSTYRYSGICGESELEKLEEVINERVPSNIETLAEEENESAPEADVLSGRFSRETDPAEISNFSTLEGEFVEDPVSNNEDLQDSAVVGLIKSEFGTSFRKWFETEEADVIENDLSESEDSVDAKRSESVENGAGTGAVESSCQKTGVTPSLVHANCASVLETGVSSFHLVQEVHDHVWGEIESVDLKEPIIKTNICISTTAKAANDERESSASVVFESIEGEDEGIAADAVQESIVEGNQDDKQDSRINVNQPCLAAAQGSVVDIDEAVRLGSDCGGQSPVNKTEDLDSKAVSREEKDLGEDNAFSKDGQFVSGESNQTEKSSLPSILNVNKEIKAGDGDKELRFPDAILVKPYQTSRGLSRIGGPDQNFCTAESFETSLPYASTCSRELEVHCEQTLRSVVSESDYAHIWKEAVTRIHEGASLTTQDPEPETPQAPQNSELRKENGTTLCENSDIRSFAECSANMPTSNDKAILIGESNETSTHQLNSEIKASETALKREPESSCGELNQIDGCWDPSHYVDHESGKEMHSTDINSCSSRTGSFEANCSRQQDAVEGRERTPERSPESLTKYSSDEGNFTPEGVLEENDTEKDFIESKSAVNTSEKGTSERSGSSSVDAAHSLQSESQSETAATQQRSSDLKGTVEIDNERQSDKDCTNVQSNSLISQRGSSNSADKEEMTKSQMDILKAVTAAFEEILELHGDDGDADDTKL